MPGERAGEGLSLDVCCGSVPDCANWSPFFACDHGGGLALENSPPSKPGSTLTGSQGSYPSPMHLAYTPAHTAPTPSHLQNTAPWHMSTCGPGSQSFAYARPLHPTPCCKARYDHTHLSHIHAYTHIYLTSSNHTHTHTPHTSDLPVTPIAHLTCIQSLTHRNRHSPSLTPACTCPGLYTCTHAHTLSPTLSSFTPAS